MAGRTYHSTKGKKRAQAEKRRAIILIIIVLVVIVILAIVCKQIFSSKNQAEVLPTEVVTTKEGRTLSLEGAPPIDVQLLTPNEYSRPQIKLNKINGIVIHYIGNPGTSAQANRDYFENLKDARTTKASSHFLVGLEGEIIQCIPTTEIAYTSNERNIDTIGIETCHPDKSGKFNVSTYESLVELTGWLCYQLDLQSSDVIRHHDVTGKICPKYFVENEDEWQQFLADVQADIDAR
jgi:N-acetylmuramoyl-L-alanine amidase